MKTNQQIKSIQRSPTLSLNEKARQYAEEGNDIIHLGIGEPLNDAPRGAVLYAQQTLDTARIKYGPTAGTAALKDVIQDYTKRHYGRSPATENIIVTSGAKQSLYNLLSVLLNPDDEVILLAPYWVSYPEMVKLAYGTPVTVTPEKSLIPDLEKVTQSITTRTKAIILNSPNNPSGVVYPPEVVAAFVDFCESEEIFLIMDDIYHRLVFDDHNWVPGYVFTSNPIDSSYIIVINGVSKTYGMTGFRVGWTVGPETVIHEMTKLQGHSTSGISEVLQEGARGALLEGEESVDELLSLIQHNRSLIVSGLQSMTGVRLVEPGGAFYCFPDFSAYEEDSQELAAFLLEKAFLVTIPGSSFGMEGHLRLSYTCTSEQITESIKRLKWALESDGPRSIIMGGEEFRRNWELQGAE